MPLSFFVFCQSTKRKTPIKGDFNTGATFSSFGNGVTSFFSLSFCVNKIVVKLHFCLLKTFVQLSLCLSFRFSNDKYLIFTFADFMSYV